MSFSFGAVLAALYGNSTDREFVASGAGHILSEEELPAAYQMAQLAGLHDAATAIAFEIRRLSGAIHSPEFNAYCHGSSHGLWRLM